MSIHVDLDDNDNDYEQDAEEENDDDIDEEVEEEEGTSLFHHFSRTIYRAHDCRHILKWSIVFAEETTARGTKRKHEGDEGDDNDG